jgi:hypothetical protein
MVLLLYCSNGRQWGVSCIVVALELIALEERSRCG